MLATEELVLDKAKPSDWKAMYRNVWSRAEIAAHTPWRISTSEDDAKDRILRTIEFQRKHDTYLVYEKASGEAIGFAGVEKVAPGVYQEAGICVGPDYARRGYGKQILRCLIAYCKQEFGAQEFIYSGREENIASLALARSLGFRVIDMEIHEDGERGGQYRLIRHSLKL